MEQHTDETLKSLAVTTIKSIRQPVATLSGGQRQSVAVARAVMWNSKLVILDEPTAALGVAQTEQVLALVRRLGQQGLGVILISHNLHDVFETADRITVLRLGRNVGIFDRRHDDPAGRRRGDHRRSADEGVGHPVHRRRRRVTHGGRRRARSRAAARGGATPDGARRALAAGVAEPAHRQPRPGADHRRRAPRHHHLRLHGHELLHRRQLRQPDQPDGRHRDARATASSSSCCSARSTSRSATSPGSGRSSSRSCSCREAATSTRASSRWCSPSPCARGSACLQGSIVAFVGRAVVRRHAGRLPDLAGRDPEHARAARHDHHPGPLDQLHRQLPLLAHAAAG